LIQPSISAIVEILAEDLYEVFEEIRCPQIVLNVKNDCPNEKNGGLADKIWRSSPIGQNCIFYEFESMDSNFFLAGNRSNESVVKEVKNALQQIINFFNKHLPRNYEQINEAKNDCIVKDVLLEPHSSNTCRLCLEVKHHANKAETKIM